MSFKLKRTQQCKGCPWKRSTDPHDIPGGYSEALHRALENTIACPGAISAPDGVMHVFACHESPVGEETHCVGWLAQQLGPGNNIPLRLSMRDCENLQHIRLDGPQHERFEDTLPDSY
jgi:hypothetical protein